MLEAVQPTFIAPGCESRAKATLTAHWQYEGAVPIPALGYLH